VKEPVPKGNPGIELAMLRIRPSEGFGALNGDRRIEPAMRREGLGEGLGLNGNSVQ